MKIKCFLALACIFTSSFKLLTAQELKKEQAFFYFMNVYNLNPSSSTFTYAMEINRCGRNYLDYYAIVFDNNNYIQKRNDEFERKSYSDKLNAKILDGINNVNFENKYTITSKAEIGEYSFSNNSFPIYFTMGLGALPLYYDNSCYLMVYVGEIVNYKYFNWYLNMPEIQAKSFIAKRKDPNGKINRKIYATRKKCFDNWLIVGDRNGNCKISKVIWGKCDRARQRRLSGI